MNRILLSCWTLALVCFNVTPASADEPSPETIRKAVEKALPLLAKGAEGHRDQKTCFGCHNQAPPMFAITTARSRGLTLPEYDLKAQTEHIAAFLDRNRVEFLKGKGTGGQADTAGYALLTLERGGWKPDETTAAVVEYLLLYQKDQNHWLTRSNRPPTEASVFTTNYVALRGLRTWGTSEQKDRIAKRIAVVRDWLLETPAKDTEDRVFRLRALKEADAPEKELQAATKALLETQRKDGGWGQLDDMDSDAYATGTALTALHEVGGLPTDDPAYQRGVAFLLKEQREDGTWLVKSRSKPFQPYYESGFPHGKNQFISSAASGWAAEALALACPPTKQVSSVK